MEFNNGNQIARECALGVLDALGPQDEMGVVLWDGKDRWLFPLSPVGDRKEKGRMIAGMNQGDLPSFENVMHMAYAGAEGNPGLRDSKANLKHMIVFSDGDPGAPSDGLMQSIVDDRITVSSVLIAGHAGPDTMIKIADQGRGRFYDVRDPSQLPQIFLKEAMVILKSAIFEEPFTPAGGRQQRGPPRHRRRRVSRPARVRLHHAQGAGRSAAGLGQGGSRAGPLAVRAGPGRGLHLRRQGQVGAGLARLGQVPPVLVAGGAVDARDAWTPATSTRRSPSNRARAS